MTEVDDPMEVMSAEDHHHCNKDSILEETRKKIKDLSDEDTKIADIQLSMNKDSKNAPAVEPTTVGAEGADECSIHVAQVDYEATPEELQAHFMCCGVINRITIICDKITGQPKGYAYIEFANKEAAETAIAMNDSQFRGRNLKVTAKRQNVPGMSVVEEAGEEAGAEETHMEEAGEEA
eukprot:CAMPEP_0171455456 /NCGR_PEP_ID=MMETSP0945-20130129/2345_1 /TAXON_ID=109269 /ORGANISM="Vaucheria litorea, Strain CCMP2940" /LENGTH=178 /DNA_ID=CAMNT_0011980703 /DNA_START=28 /DNA_END=561 /DNA_ORIENTATION=+